MKYSPTFETEIAAGPFQMKNPVACSGLQMHSCDHSESRKSHVMTNVVKISSILTYALTVIHAFTIDQLGVIMYQEFYSPKSK